MIGYVLRDQQGRFVAHAERLREAERAAKRAVRSHPSLNPIAVCDDEDRIVMLVQRDGKLTYVTRPGETP